MRILLLTHAFNSLTQRLHVELRQLGHEVSVEFDIKDSVTVEAVALFRPDLIVAPFLKRAIPEAVWSQHVCLVVHPGPEGDRGPSALDWAILEGKETWGVTVLQANAEMDGGPVWESRSFPMRAATKGSIYRNEVTEAAVEAVLACVARFPDAKSHPALAGVWKPAMKQADRAIDWVADDTQTVLRKVRCGDGVPGVLATVAGQEVFLHDAHEASGLSGAPGALLAQGNGAVAVACRGGAVWIGHVRQRGGIKLPAGRLLGQGLPDALGPQDITYEERGDVGILHFSFLNGAMGTEQCRRLLAAYDEACRRPTKVIVLTGGPDFWSNGIHLNLIEEAASPADESWANINAMDDLCRAIITTTSHVTIAALRGNAGAGGVFLALAADYVWARTGVVLNPHYKGMGNLYGSEYWTYLLPKRAGEAAAKRVTEARLPMGTLEAKELGLIDDYFASNPYDFLDNVLIRAEQTAHESGFPERLVGKRTVLEQDGNLKPLESFRTAELDRMTLNFYGFDPSYHVARHDFVFKIAKSHTPLSLAIHRRKAAKNPL